MIRTVTEADAPAVVALAIASGLFPEADAETVRSMMAGYFDRGRSEGHVCLIDIQEEPVAVAYYQPVPATEGTWYLTMIAVRRASQGRGRGRALMRRVEEDLIAGGQRLLLVETSGIPGFELTRAFYDKCGYTQEARVRDFYEPGDDMVLYRKTLLEGRR